MAIFSSVRVRARRIPVCRLAGAVEPQMVTRNMLRLTLKLLAEGNMQRRCSSFEIVETRQRQGRRSIQDDVKFNRTTWSGNRREAMVSRLLVIQEQKDHAAPTSANRGNVTSVALELRKSFSLIHYDDSVGQHTFGPISPLLFYLLSVEG